jgi:uncharacterized protein YbjQ (UPF0145 family)
MKKHIILALSSVFFYSSLSFARDDVIELPIAEALNTQDAKTKLGENIAFYFGDQAHATSIHNFSHIKTNKKTNAFNKTDTEACQWAFLSAMIALRDSALEKGGDAVIDIKSNYKNNLTSSTETFQCGAGNLMAGVALTGTVVLLNGSEQK